jgi:hypothetical protein
VRLYTGKHHAKPRVVHRTRKDMETSFQDTAALVCTMVREQDELTQLAESNKPSPVQNCCISGVVMFTHLI